MRTCLIALFALLAFASFAQMKETKTRRDQRMKWWREARLGMFIHWGLYSVPAGEWHGKTTYGEWIRDEAHIPVSEYEKLLARFNPVKFDAEAWVKMARDAGMTYVVITTKHHEGFDLFHTEYSAWSVEHTPFQRDIMAAMAAACKKYGLKMCWYHSIMDWHHPDYLPRRPWEAATRSAEGASMDRYVEYLRSQVTELLTRYGPIGVMWFDGEWEPTWNTKYGDALYTLCRQLQPNVIVNNRVTVGRGGIEDGGNAGVGDFGTPEQTIPPDGLPGIDWETCMTMNDHWGYNSHDKDWKSSTELLHNVVDIASKGGNYLLNVGPRADGTFPPESVERLRDIGKWMRAHGDSIYGTTASVFDKLAWGRSTTKREGSKTILYLHVFDRPSNGKLIIPGLGNEVVGIKPALKWKRVGPDVEVQVPAFKEPVYTFALTVVGAPIVYKTPKIIAPATVLVDSVAVRLDSGSSELQIRYTLDGSDPTTTAALYKEPVDIQATGTIRAAAFHHGKRVSGIVEQHFEKVSPWPAMAAAPAASGLWCEEFTGNWDVLPDFAKLKPARAATSVIGPIEVEGKMAEYVGRRYTGFLKAPANAVYVFALTADDGADLWFDGKRVVDNGGLHGAITKTGTAPLAAGWHRIEIRWFNKTGNAALSVDWGKAGGKQSALQSIECGFDPR